MSKTIDVTALGDLLIDFTENGTSGQGNPLMEANPGGAPCNVLAMLQKLGKNCAFIGKVGQDAFGDMLEKTLKEAGYEHIRVTDTTLGRGQAWPLVRVIRQSMQDGMPHLVVCRFPDAL